MTDRALPPGTFVHSSDDGDKPTVRVLTRGWGSQLSGQCMFSQPEHPDITHWFKVGKYPTGKTSLPTPVPIVDARRVEVIRRYLRMNPVKGLDAVYGVQKALSMGADPEVFVTTKDGVVIPAWKFLQKYVINGGFHQQYWDGFQAEFGVYPQYCHDAMVEELANGLSEIAAKARANGLEHNFPPQSVVQIPEEMLQKEADEHVILGCTPSHNVYGDSGQPVEDPRKLPIRFAGGHIHFNIPFLQDSPGQIEILVRTLDNVLGVAGVALADKFDDPRRRVFYGRAGEFRLPKYGLEYRVLSNFWLVAPQVSHLVLDFARRVAALGLVGLKMWQGNENETREVINSHDVPRAREILKRNAKFLLWLLPYSKENNFRAIQLMQTGVLAKFPCTDMWSNWRYGVRRWRS